MFTFTWHLLEPQRAINAVVNGVRAACASLTLVSNSLQAQAGSAASFLQSAAPGKVMKRKSDGVFYLKKKKKTPSQRLETGRQRGGRWLRNRHV